MTAQPVKKPMVGKISITQPVDDPTQPVARASVTVSGSCDSSVTSVDVKIINPATNYVAAVQTGVAPSNGTWSVTFQNVIATDTISHAWNVVMATGNFPSGSYTDMHRIVLV
jgi:hypothetical protein